MSVYVCLLLLCLSWRVFLFWLYFCFIGECVGARARAGHDTYMGEIHLCCFLLLFPSWVIESCLSMHPQGWPVLLLFHFFDTGECVGARARASPDTYMGKIPSYDLLLLTVSCCNKSYQCLSAVVEVFFWRVSCTYFCFFQANVWGLELEQAMTHTWAKYLTARRKWMTGQSSPGSRYAICTAMCKLYIYIYIYICVCMHDTYKCTYVYIHIYIYVYIHIYIYIYIHIYVIYMYGQYLTARRKWMTGPSSPGNRFVMSLYYFSVYVCLYVLIDIDIYIDVYLFIWTKTDMG